MLASLVGYAKICCLAVCEVMKLPIVAPQSYFTLKMGIPRYPRSWDADFIWGIWEFLFTPHVTTIQLPSIVYHTNAGSFLSYAVFGWY